MTATKRKRRTIRRSELLRLQVSNSDKIPPVVVFEDGHRYRWVGITWVDEGPAHKGDVRMIED